MHGNEEGVSATPGARRRLPQNLAPHWLVVNAPESNRRRETRAEERGGDDATAGGRGRGEIRERARECAEQGEPGAPSPLPVRLRAWGAKWKRRAARGFAILLTPGFVAKRVRYLTDLQLDGAHRRLAKSDGHRANE
jgi:hypothetical protein